jgi:hypothetical protein
MPAIPAPTMHTSASAFSFKGAKPGMSAVAIQNDVVSADAGRKKVFSQRSHNAQVI